MNTSEIMARLKVKYANEKEYLQAVQEVLETIEDVYNRHPEFEEASSRRRRLSKGLWSLTGSSRSR